MCNVMTFPDSGILWRDSLLSGISSTEKKECRFIDRGFTRWKPGRVSPLNIDHNPAFMSSLPKPNRRSTLLSTMFVAGIFILVAGLIPLPVKSQKATLNSVAPAIAPTVLNLPGPHLSQTDLQGNLVSIQPDRGKVILVNIRAAQCPPCQDGMPDLQAHYTSHARQGLPLSLSNQENLSTRSSAFFRIVD